MQIKSAEFIMSNSDPSKCPGGAIPEYAFIGRSNVGKSSLINNLTGRRHLAKTSGRPGKTQLINHFIINKQWYLVDLPGYGYARASKKDIKRFQKHITDYFKTRQQLLCAFVLVDIRHEPQSIDQEFMAWLTENGIPFNIIFTKADKLKPGARQKKVDAYLQQMLEEAWEEAPDYFISSSTSGLGKEEILAYIDAINKEFTDSQQPFS